MIAFFEYQEANEATMEANEALITKFERREKFNALQQKNELPLDQLFKHYKMGKGNEMLLFVQLAMFWLFEHCIVFGSLVECAV